MCGFKFLCNLDNEANQLVNHDRMSEFVRDKLMVGLYDESTKPG